MKRSENRVETLQDLITVIEDVNRCFQGQVWWRGQRCAEWELTPSVFRDGRGNDDERSAGIRFRQRAISRNPRVPALDDNFSWMIWMQHHGLPTRLLDWTESPLTAAFFACGPTSDVICGPEEDTGQDSALYALNPFLLNENQAGDRGLFVPEDQRVQDVILAAFHLGAVEESKILAVRPPEMFPRMTAQLSTFTVHSKDCQLESIDSTPEFLIQFRIPAEARKELTEGIKWLGIRSASLFPDLDHLGEEIRQVKFLASEREKDRLSVDHMPGIKDQGRFSYESSS